MPIPHSRFTLPATALALWSLLTCGQALAAVGTFHFVHGPVTLVGADRAERPVKKGDPVNVGDVVSTAAGAAAHIQMVDGTLLSMRAGTQLRIENYAAGTTGQKLLGLLQGGLRALSQALRGAAHVAVRTDTAVIGVRGTDHEVFHVRPDRGPPGARPGTYDRVYDGGITMQTRGGKLDVNPRQVGYAEDPDKPPVLLDGVPDFLAGTPARIPPTLSAGDDGTGAGSGMLASAGGQPFPPGNFVQAPTPLATMQSIGGIVTFNTIVGASLPVTETGAVGGRVTAFAASFNLSTPGLDSISIAVTDAASRNWTGNNTYAAGPIGINANGTFTAPFTAFCTGCVQTQGSPSSATLQVMGNDAASVFASYQLQAIATFTETVTGTVTATR
jgi:hypothetical protein